MSARTIWKGRIRFEGVEVPVRLFTAVEQRGLHFRLLHADDETPVTQHMLSSESGEVVPGERIRRALEVEPGVLVLLEDEELASVDPPSDRDIEILAFVRREQVSTAWYERPYWLGPDGADEAYSALAATLAKSDRLGIARWTMRKRRYVGALRSEGPYLMLSTLRHLGEVVSRDALGPAPHVAIDPLEQQLAEQLVSTLEEKDFDLSRFHDTHRERVLALIEAKARGEKPRVEAPPPKKKEAASLAEALRASLSAAGKERRVA